MAQPEENQLLAFANKAFHKQTFCNDLLQMGPGWDGNCELKIALLICLTYEKCLLLAKQAFESTTWATGFPVKLQLVIKAVFQNSISTLSLAHGCHIIERSWLMTKGVIRNDMRRFFLQISCNVFSSLLYLSFFL